MELPKQVRDAQQRSDDAIARIKAEADKAAGITPPETEPKNQDPPPTETPQPDQPAPERKDYKAMYLTLNGKYQAEVPRLHADLKAANAKIEELTVELGKLRAQAQQPAQPAQQQAPSLEISDEVRALLGDDAIEAMRKIALSEMERHIDPVKQKAEAAAKSVEEIEAERAVAARERFILELKAEVPKFEEIDQRDDWKLWLSQDDPVSGRQRQALIAEAVQSFNAKRVAAIFKAFMAETGITQKAREVPAHMETPATSGRPVTGNVEKKRWTKAEVSAEYQRIATGKYTQAEAQKVEAEIVAAAREGRIIG